ncbi:NAD(P)/FAD-dependent oxidoreductase [Mycobacteroides abscessus]|uniref:phytoene desaturase family protein n=1 Tax=Mycobacteroides abscessus TaxID=36809 RepID=UPI0011A11855|nr:NAD(P)/FAD-dependent oxidoreductase [Mycobacteroides abscessus]
MTAGESYKRSDISETWDTIVIGSGIGGMAAAALLARAGQRVLVLERHSTAGGATQTFRRAGYEWDAGLHYIGQVHRPASALRRIFDYISDGELHWEPMADVYNRIVVDDQAYEYPSGEAAFRERMCTYFPDEADAIDRYLELVRQANRSARTYFAHRALPPAAAEEAYDDMCAPFRTYSDRTVSEVLSELTQSETLKTVLAGHYGDYSLAPGRASFAVHAMLIRHYIDGASFPVGGSARLAQTAAEVIRRADGAVLVAAEVAEVSLDEDGRAVGVMMRDGRRLRSDAVISDAGALNTLTRLLPPEAADTGMIEALRSVGPSQPWVVLNIGIRESGAELGLDKSNLWIHRGAGIDSAIADYEADPANRPMPLYFLTSPSTKDPSWTDRHPGRSTIDIAGMTSWRLFEPFAATTWMDRGEDYAKLKHALTEELTDQVLRFCPQLRGKLDHLELATPLSFNHFLNREYGDFMSLASTPERFAVTKLGAHTGVANLYLTGQDVAAAGVVGAVQGAVVAASAVLGRNAMSDISQLDATPER